MLVKIRIFYNNSIICPSIQEMAGVHVQSSLPPEPHEDEEVDDSVLGMKLNVAIQW